MLVVVCLMSNTNEGEFDEDILCIITQADNCFLDVGDMSSDPDSSPLDISTVDFTRTSPCYALVARLRHPPQLGLESLLNITL